MVTKALVIASFAAGYVVGAKAGRERYEQVRTLFLRVTKNPDVREKAHTDLRPHGASIDPDSSFAINL